MLRYSTHKIQTIIPLLLRFILHFIFLIILHWYNGSGEECKMSEKFPDLFTAMTAIHLSLIHFYYFFPSYLIGLVKRVFTYHHMYWQFVEYSLRGFGIWHDLYSFSYFTFPEFFSMIQKKRNLQTLHWGPLGIWLYFNVSTQNQISAYNNCIYDIQGTIGKCSSHNVVTKMQQQR